jgi:hypothetical protein
MPTSKDRPGAWNDDVIWLLERVAGLLADQGKGTGSGTLPRGIATSGVVHYVRGTHTDVGPAEETTIQLPQTTRSWLLVGLTYHRTGGTATAVEPRLGQAAGFTTDGPDDRVALGPQAVATGINAVFCKPIPLRADTDFRVYLRPGFDAGADNDGIYQLWLQQGIETAESTP